MRRSSSIRRLEAAPEREMVVIRLPVRRKPHVLRARLDIRVPEAGVVLVTLALVVLLLVCVRHGVEAPAFTPAPPPGSFMLPVGP
jgi:hypothetical protein